MATKNQKKDLFTAIKFYIEKILSDPSLKGNKALLLDPITAKIVSMVLSQTQILENGVYCIEMLGKEREPMRLFKAAVFIQPTEDNFEKLIREIHAKNFDEYHIFFSNIVPQDMLARLGRADEKESIMQVQEYFADYLVINEDLFQLGVENSLCLSSPTRNLESRKVFERNVNGILSTLLSFKKIPSQIRYSVSSEIARGLANDVLTIIEKGEPFDYVRQEGLTLLILDRRDDPITPLLTQWTYQAMVHELLGLEFNRVKVKKSATAAAAQSTPTAGAAAAPTSKFEEYVLSSSQDEFFSKNRNANFGDISVAVKNLLDEYQKASKKNENINSIEDMQHFLDRYPEFRSKSLNISKHVAVLSELSRLVDECRLLDISELEQEISCSNDHSGQKEELIQFIRDTKVNSEDKLRLSIIFLIKYEGYNELREIKSLLLENKVAGHRVSLLDAVLDYCGESRRAPGLFSQGGMMAKFMKSFSSVGTQNVFTQHQPLLNFTLQNIVNGKLKDSSYPPLHTAVGVPAGVRPNELIVFIVGGVTYEEAKVVTEFNASGAGMKVFLGGSSVQNSSSFLKEIADVFGR